MTSPMAFKTEETLGKIWNKRNGIDIRNSYRKYEAYTEIPLSKKKHTEDSGLDNKLVKTKKSLKSDTIRYDCIDLSQSRFGLIMFMHMNISFLSRNYCLSFVPWWSHNSRYVPGMFHGPYMLLFRKTYNSHQSNSICFIWLKVTIIGLILYHFHQISTNHSNVTTILITLKSR